MKKELKYFLIGMGSTLGTIIIIIGVIVLFQSDLFNKDNNNDDSNPSKTYKLNKTITCEAFNKEIKYITNDTIITADNSIYIYNTEQKYSNNTNCIIVALNNDIKFFDAENRLFYNNESHYLTIDAYELKVDKKDKDNRVKQIIANGYTMTYTANYSPDFELLYGIKNDNNIYSFELHYNWSSNGAKYSVKNEEIVYSVPEEEIITDFAYRKDEYGQMNNYARTNKGYYDTVATNKKECEEFADVKCTYEWQKNKTKSEKIENIIYIDSNMYITKEGKIFNLSY